MVNPVSTNLRFKALTILLFLISVMIGCGKKNENLEIEHLPCPHKDSTAMPKWTTEPGYQVTRVQCNPGLETDTLPQGRKLYFNQDMSEVVATFPSKRDYAVIYFVSKPKRNAWNLEFDIDGKGTCYVYSKINSTLVGSNFRGEVKAGEQLCDDLDINVQVAMGVIDLYKYFWLFKDRPWTGSLVQTKAGYHAVSQPSPYLLDSHLFCAHNQAETLELTPYDKVSAF